MSEEIKTNQAAEPSVVMISFEHFQAVEGRLLEQIDGLKQDLTEATASIINERLGHLNDKNGLQANIDQLEARLQDSEEQGRQLRAMNQNLEQRVKDYEGYTDSLSGKIRDLEEALALIDR